MRSSIEGIQLCLANAQRLFLDATKVSSPTAAALFEISLEEYAKAWMLYFHYINRHGNRKTSNQERTSVFAPTRQQIKKLVAFDRKYHEYLANPPIEDAFRKHLVKLDFLRVILEFEEANLSLFPVMRKHLGELDLEYSGGAISLPKITPTQIEGLKKFLGRFKKEGITQLDLIKNKGLYADMQISGEIISPETRIYPLVELGALCNILGSMLQGVILSAGDEARHHPH